MCPASFAPTITTSPTAIDACQYANEGVCDEPTYCAYGTDCTDCGNCMSGTPTAAPTLAVVSAAFQITLSGTNSSSFSASEQSGFKLVIANSSGNVCGVDGSDVCSTSDVTIVSFSRRSLSVSFMLDTRSASSASSAYWALAAYIGSSSFFTDLVTAGSVNATGVEIVTSSVTTIAPTMSSMMSVNGAPVNTVFSVMSLVIILVRCLI